MKVCGGTSFTTLSDACVREFWAAVIPLSFVGFVLLAQLPLVRAPLRTLQKTFTNFLPLHEAEALGAGEVVVEVNDGETLPEVPLRRTVILSSVSLVETLLWLCKGGYSFVASPEDIWSGIRDLLIAVTWIFATLRPVVRPTATAPYDLLFLFVAHFLLGVLTFFGRLYDHYVHGIPMPTLLSLTASIINLAAVVCVIILVANMPMGIPSKQVKKENIGKSVSPEDYTSVWGWMSFRWILPLLEKGTYNTLNEADVWSLSPSMQARPLHIKFSQTTGKLLMRLWRANSFDLVIEFILTYTSVVFDYAAPFFLRRILDALTESDRHPEKRAIAFVYACLAFGSSLCKAQAHLQHLWYSRRACVRIRTELMSAIYDKALKRKNFSGIVDQDATSKTGDEPKADADIGKIVNFMAGDVDQIAEAASVMHLIYSAPFKIFIASLLLYQLLGWSAFTGFFVLALGGLLNSFVAKCAIRIQKGVSSARDKRMSVLNELISTVKFIKFSAQENHWIQRVLDAREVEMQWLLKFRLNSVLFTTIWNCASGLVSVTSFLVYIAQDNELTIGTAFTAIALIQMVRLPLDVISVRIVEMLKAKVALDRIATYLDEQEVDKQVSTIKKGCVPPGEDSEIGLGVVNGSFKWHDVKEKGGQDKRKVKDCDKMVKVPAGRDDVSTIDDAVTAVEDVSVASIAEASVTDHRFELRDINVMFPDGQLTLVTGPTASGKTTLLIALLGELATLGGRIVMSKNPSKVDQLGLSHTISYSAQSPWLRHRSIKDNILFGQPYDDQRYNAVIRCCALKPDLDILEDGDATEIGVRGVSLSGGQKARVALARAVYAPSKYVLLDDPLSSVDSPTARFLFEELLRGPLLANRTVVLVTHHVKLVLPGAYYLVRMLDGRIDTQGTVEELRESGALDELFGVEEVETHKGEQTAKEKNPNVEIDEETNEEEIVLAKDEKKPRKLVEEEHREMGVVKWEIYKTYLKASSYWTWGLMFCLIVLAHLVRVGERFWIKIWGEAYGEGDITSQQLSYSYSTYADQQQVLHDGFSHFHPMTMVQFPAAHAVTSWQLPPAHENPYFYVGIYAAITQSAGIIHVCGIIIQYTGALRASRILFDRLLRTVVRANMRWHDTTPQGRTLNRFSKDIEMVDTSVSTTFHEVNWYISAFAVSLLTIIAVFPLFVFPVSILGYFYARSTIVYLNTARDIRRMESNTRSPIFANFSELLEGIVTIRAFSAEQRFLNDLFTNVDLTTKMHYTFWMANRWLMLTFDTLGGMTIFAAMLFALSGYVNAGLAGVCITSAILFPHNVYWACRSWTALQLELNSVERVVEYLDLPQEPATVIESNRPPAYWPSSSSQNKDAMLVVEDLHVKYAPDLPAVLRGISFSLKAKERVGLLGRTGSGKSTLAMSILRFVDPASGKIMIDGIDICSIGLHDLRSRITYIPQEATLFSGSLRDNLDPFNEHTDAECLDVLHRVQLLTDSQIASQQASRFASRATSIHEGESGRAPIPAPMSTVITETKSKTLITLDAQISPGGANFSQGQRQLIAMARALLCRSAIIVLDEATSSIDFATDAKIQATIREEFNNSMLLTVAHRLRTVIDYDRLIVLDKGELAEFDTPLKLIQKEGGIFRRMCLKSGTFAELEAAAKAKAEQDAH